MNEKLKKFVNRLMVNLIMTLVLILITAIPIIFLVIAGDMYLDDVFNFLENIETLADYGVAVSFIYGGLLLAYAICCFSVRKIRTGWTVFLSIISILEAVGVIVLTIINL
jgi:hypothetical protein